MQFHFSPLGCRPHSQNSNVLVLLVHTKRNCRNTRPECKTTSGAFSLWTSGAKLEASQVKRSYRISWSSHIESLINWFCKSMTCFLMDWLSDTVKIWQNSPEKTRSSSSTLHVMSWSSFLFCFVFTVSFAFLQLVFSSCSHFSSSSSLNWMWPTWRLQAGCT